MWTKPDTIVMVHGFCRNSAFWYAWIPILSRRFRVLCPTFVAAENPTYRMPAFGGRCSS
jgi:hypothetical protein